MIDLDLIRDIASWIFFLLGAVGIVTGAIGIVRFPDFYARLHASGITDTAGAELILFGMILQAAPNWLIVAKLVFIGFFLFMTSPVSTHAIAHAAWTVGLRPMLGPELKREGENQ